MNDYKTVLKENQELQYLIKNQLKEMSFLSDKMDRFKGSMSLMEEDIKKSLENHSNEFDFINKLFNDYIQQINNLFLSYDEQISAPLKDFIRKFYSETNNNLNLFHDIKMNLIESKQKVTKARDDYYNYIEKNNKNEKENEKNKDAHELLKAKEENFAQLYKYEINKMNEIISQNNQKYDSIFKNLDGINKNMNENINTILNRFSETLEKIGNIFISLSKKLKESLTNEYFKKFIPQIDEKTKMRFNLENFEEYKNCKPKNDMKEKKPQEEIKEKNIDNKKENINNNSIKRVESIPNKGFDDFEIIGGPLEVINQAKMEENIMKFQEIIEKLASENELLPSEITQLINILKEDPPGRNGTLSYIFLMKIKEFYINRVINFKNRQNFIHLANIMNNLCIKENNTKTFNAIIEVSQMIKFEKIFMYGMIQKKNHFFSTKTFWLTVLEDNLINNINNYAYKLKTQKSKKTKKDENEKNINKNKNPKKYLLRSIGLDKNITNYHKLNKQQKKDLDKYATENICKILSKTIPGMCSFLVPEFTSIDIIRHYCKRFNLDNKTFQYFQNILEAKNIKNTLGLKKNTEKSKQKNAILNIITIISNSLKYLPKKDYINLIPLNKSLKPLIEKKIFKFLLSEKNLRIDKRITLWSIMLKVETMRKFVDYETVKNIMKERIDKNEIIKNSNESKNLSTIDVDLLRTPFINKNKEHIEKTRWILRCLNYTKPEVGYRQGMSFLVLFFYQLLDYNEQKTFYFLFSLEMETKYKEIFRDDLHLLKIYYIVLDKIINLYKPEIYYKFVDNNLSTNYYSTSWFVTLFTNTNCVFEKNNAPKYVIKVMEDFILDGWSAIFNSGFTLTRYYFKKIMEIEGDQIINYMIKDLCSEDIIKNENFNKIEKYYDKNSEIINEMLINKLVKIANYENNHSFQK